jgi:hypothetical protein
LMQQVLKIERREEVSTVQNYQRVAKQLK